MRSQLFTRRILNFVLLTVFLFAATAAQSRLPSNAQTNATRPLLSEVQRYVDVHKQSLEFQLKAQSALKMLPRDGRAREGAFPELLESMVGLKREYFALREVLFKVVFLHASAIVEKPDPRNLRDVLLRSSLSLEAGVDLTRNFQTVAEVLRNSSFLREIWNQADPAHGIPEAAWEISIQTSHNEFYRDLLRQAIKRVKRHQLQVDRYRLEGDENFLALFPDGTAIALRGAEQNAALLLSAFAEEDLTEDERMLRILVERSKELRTNWNTSSRALSGAIARERGLIRGDIHLQIQVAKQDYITVREALYQLAFKHLPKLTRDDVPYPAEFRLHAIAVSVLAAVTLYENARYIESVVLRVPNLRDLLNEGDPALGIPPRFWDNIEREFVRVEYRNFLQAGIQALERQPDRPRTISADNDPLLTYVGEEIARHAVVSNIRGEQFPSKTARVLRFYALRMSTLAQTAPMEGKTQLSKRFGNFMGMFEFRKGKLFNQPHWVEFVQKRLQPGDIVLEKTPFRLTDKFIPGHFGHVAVYVGTESQLRDLGLHTHPLIIQYASQIAEGKIIVEALRDGTQLSSAQHFLNIDDLAILRPKPGAIPPGEVIQAIILAFSHLGKKYDFGFDTKTWDTIVCSELAFQSYVNVRWTFGKVLSSYTISPDDVAIFAGSDKARPFDLITFVHDGQVVHDRLTGINKEDLYISLLGKHYADAGR